MLSTKTYSFPGVLAVGAPRDAADVNKVYFSLRGFAPAVINEYSDALSELLRIQSATLAPAEDALRDKRVIEPFGSTSEPFRTLFRANASVEKKTADGQKVAEWSVTADYTTTPKKQSTGMTIPNRFTTQSSGFVGLADTCTSGYSALDAITDSPFGSASLGFVFLSLGAAVNISGIGSPSATFSLRKGIAHRQPLLAVGRGYSSILRYHPDDVWAEMVPYTDNSFSGFGTTKGMLQVSARLSLSFEGAWNADKSSDMVNSTVAEGPQWEGGARRTGEAVVGVVVAVAVAASWAVVGW